MPENTSLPLTETVVSPDTAVSPAVAAVLEKAHTGATGVIELEADQRNLIRYYGLKLKGAIDWICWKPVNPQELSKTVISIQQLRLKEAGNDAQANIAA